MEKNQERNGHKRRAAIEQTRGSLLIIGGHENKQGGTDILQEVAARANKGKLVVATLASEDPKPLWDEYRRVFSKLGVHEISQLDARHREELITEPHEET